MQVALHPLITEKSMQDAKNGKFTFRVGNVNKNAISKAVEKTFGVDVMAVSTILIKGRTKRVGARRVERKESAFKKAIVELKKGQKIDIFDIGEKK